MEEYDPKKPFNENILEKIRKTWIPNILQGQIYNCDGIGTKGLLHWQERTFVNGARDAWANSINDMVRDRAFPPYVVIDHLMLQEEDKEAIDIIMDELTRLAIHSQATIVAGETAILDTLQGFEVGITMIGKIRGEDIHNSNKIVSGDIVIGLESSGPHSNGFTKIRQIIKEQGLSLKDQFPWGRRVGEELTIPTYIYSDSILRCLEVFSEYIHGMVNITGGAFTKIKKILNGEYDIHIRNAHKLKPQEIFYYIKEKGNLDDKNMLERFNCGIGFILIVDPEIKDEILRVLKWYHKSEIIGSIAKGNGKINIISPFSGKEIYL
jgi:phosphoribosylformylglycinamidine cyclo-ligase